MEGVEYRHGHGTRRVGGRMGVCGVVVCYSVGWSASNKLQE